MFQQKDSPWEGAIRSAAAIWSPRLKRRQRVSNQPIHISDWLPTFAKIAGVNIEGTIDGRNVWNALSYNFPSPRREILAHHDPEVPFMAYISENFKLISGSTYKGFYDQWLSKPIDSSEENAAFGDVYAQAILSSNVGQALSKYSTTNKQQTENYVGTTSETITDDEINEIRQKAKVTCNGFTPPNNDSIKACNPIVSPCLFDIHNDPCETTNLAKYFPDIVKKLQSKLDYYGRIARPIRNKPGDSRSNPADFNGTWTWWYDELNITTNAGKFYQLNVNACFICVINVYVRLAWRNGEYSILTLILIHISFTVCKIQFMLEICFNEYKLFI